MTDTPKFITVAIRDTWGVAELHAPAGGDLWADMKRSGLRFEDAADLRDAWNARGAEKRP